MLQNILTFAIVIDSTIAALFGLTFLPVSMDYQKSKIINILRVFQL